MLIRGKLPLLLSLLSVANLHNKTNCALFLNKYLNSIVKNHQGGIRRIRANRGRFTAKPVDTLHLCFIIKFVSKRLMTTLVLSRSLATALKFLDVW